MDEITHCQWLLFYDLNSNQWQIHPNLNRSSDDEKVSACPQGQVPFKQSLNKKTRTAFFTHSTCDSCSKRSQCPVLDR
jgi:hypothetical protein